MYEWTIGREQRAHEASPASRTSHRAGSRYGRVSVPGWADSPRLPKLTTVVRALTTIARAVLEPSRARDET